MDKFDNFDNDNFDKLSKQLDHKFNSELRDFEALPHTDMWNKIAQELPPATPIIPFYQKGRFWGGFSILFLLISLSGFFFSQYSIEANIKINSKNKTNTTPALTQQKFPKSSSIAHTVPNNLKKDCETPILVTALLENGPNPEEINPPFAQLNQPTLKTNSEFDQNTADEASQNKNILTHNSPTAFKQLESTQESRPIFFFNYFFQKGILASPLVLLHQNKLLERLIETVDFNENHDAGSDHLLAEAVSSEFSTGFKGLQTERFSNPIVSSIAPNTDFSLIENEAFNSNILEELPKTNLNLNQAKGISRGFNVGTFYQYQRSWNLNQEEKSSDLTKKDFEYQSNIGSAYGLSLSFDFNKKAGIQTEWIFNSQHGYNVDYTQSSRTQNYAIQQNYMLVPVYFKYRSTHHSNLTKQNMIFNHLVGIQYGKTLYSKEYINDYLLKSDDYQDQASWGLVLGMDYDLYFTRSTMLSLGARSSFSRDLGNFNDLLNAKPPIHLVLGLNASLKYRFQNK